MIAELLLVLAGHPSSLFPEDHTIHPSFSPLLHPGEQQCLESLGKIAFRYRKVKAACASLSTASSSSRYISTLCTAITHILRDDYESLVIATEAKVLRRDANLVANGSFVPLSSIRATFSEWDAPLVALVSLVEEMESRKDYPPGPLIDLLLERSKTGVHRIAAIFSQFAQAVERVWRTQLIAFLVHGSLSPVDPLVSESYALLDGAMPSCVSLQTRESIVYVGRAIATVKAAKWQKQLPVSLALEHASSLECVLPEDQSGFDHVIAQIRINVSEWLWLNILTMNEVEDVVDTLANYFLLRNGEFSLSLIREIERLKLSRLTVRSSSTSMIREQDLNLAILRASLGTTAQHDPSLSHLRFLLPSGPLRPLLPSLGTAMNKSFSNSVLPSALDLSLFNSTLLGTPLTLTYIVEWPLDLFIHPTDLNSYAALFSYLSALRKTHTNIHTCWTSLSNSQRARRRWTGLGEGGTAEDLNARTQLLRCGWGISRDMSWFLDTLLGYVMIDVVDVEYARLKKQLAGDEHKRGLVTTNSAASMQSRPSRIPISRSAASVAGVNYLDFTTLRQIHATYLDRLLTGCLLTYPEVTSIVSQIFEVCERFVAQVERWGGDILPALLFEGSIRGEDMEVGALVRERHQIVADINETLHELLNSFYEQLSTSTFQQPFSSADASKSMHMNATIANYTTFNMSKMAKVIDGDKADVRRHVERLMLRLDFNGGFSKFKWKNTSDKNILAQGGVA
ncbi:gamma-tubulin ring complex protein [Dendrothele bispora CBS 962.96]|uniref:Spindle pole body component n=1 Tax=Dendrothele bispora (strain CBS 962.96) TaxID=1314807 RepID=A0A4S8MW13_DENBC|nr:gamma-tubulin ring complex protein [Dendrothele bispora CBS 962.96]